MASEDGDDSIPGSGEPEALHDLLDSALQDFNKLKTTDDDLDDFMSSYDREAAQKAAVKFNEMLENMASSQAAEKEKSSEVSGKRELGEHKEDDQFMEELNKFLQQSKSLANAPDEKSFLEALQNLDENSTAADLMSSILNVTISKELMYSEVKMMSEKYDEFLTENKDKLDENLYKQYQEQHRIMKELVKEYEKMDENDRQSSSKNEHSSTVAKLWLELQAHGFLPPEIATAAPGVDLLDGNNDVSQLNNIEGCSIM